MFAAETAGNTYFWEVFKMSLQEKPHTLISEVTIREFRPGDEICFRTLNEEWIERYFRVEPKEAIILADPKGTILDAGGKIFFAVLDDRCVGCCALRRMSDTEFEVAKMAVTPACQGAGIGRKLLHTVIEAGRSSGARRLYLETNHELKPAIRLYESMGFRYLSPDKIIPSPYARADVYMELFFR
jgi:ribosomal protein S18 acetylase RimI-like enzyme